VKSGGAARGEFLTRDPASSKAKRAWKAFDMKAPSLLSLPSSLLSLASRTLLCYFPFFFLFPFLLSAFFRTIFTTAPRSRVADNCNRRRRIRGGKEREESLDAPLRILRMLPFVIIA